MVSAYSVADTIFTPINASAQDGIARTLTLFPPVTTIRNAAHYAAAGSSAARDFDFAPAALAR